MVSSLTGTHEGQVQCLQLCSDSCVGGAGTSVQLCCFLCVVLLPACVHCTQTSLQMQLLLYADWLGNGTGCECLRLRGLLGVQSIMQLLQRAGGVCEGVYVMSGDAFIKRRACKNKKCDSPCTACHALLERVHAHPQDAARSTLQTPQHQGHGSRQLRSGQPLLAQGCLPPVQQGWGKGNCDCEPHSWKKSQ